MLEVKIGDRVILSDPHNTHAKWKGKAGMVWRIFPESVDVRLDDDDLFLRLNRGWLTREDGAGAPRDR
jgi:hypothetical protein